MEKNYKFRPVYLVPIFNITPSVNNLPSKKDSNYSEIKDKIFGRAISLYNATVGTTGLLLTAKGISEFSEFAGKFLENLVK